MATSESWLSAEEFSRGEVEISKRKIQKQEEATRVNRRGSVIRTAFLKAQACIAPLLCD